MSLVNQMLRDLEKRRAGERHGTGGVFQGLVGTAAPRGGRTGPFLVLGMVVVALGGAVGYLLWERSARGAAEGSPAARPAIASRPAEPVPVPLAPGFVALEPAPERPVETVVVAREGPAPVPMPVAAPPRRTAARAPAPVVPQAPEPPVPVEKRPIPPTPEQRAAVAHQQAYEALRAGQRDEAERHWREALRHAPDHIAAREGLAGLLLAAGRRVEAGELLGEGVSRLPQVGSFRKLQARLRVEEGDLAGAVALLEAGADGAGRDGDYQALLGALYQRQNAFARSMARYQQALLLSPNQGVWWVGLAISAEGAGQTEDALTAYKRALGSGVGEKLAAYARERIGALEPKPK